MIKYPSKIKVGRFNETQLGNKEDKIAVDKCKLKTGYKYIVTSLGKKNGEHYIDIYLISDKDYYSTNQI